MVMAKKAQPIEQTVETLVELLEDYEDIGSLGADLALDRLLTVKRDLVVNKGAEGHVNEPISIMVRQGEQLPKTFETRTFESAMADVAYEIFISEILGMSWTPDYDVIVRVLGTKSKAVPLAEGVH